MFGIVVTSLVIGCILSCIIIFYVTIKETSKVQLSALLLSISCLLMFLGYLFECFAINKEEALLAVKIGYIGKPIGLYLFYLFLATHTRRRVSIWFSILSSISQTFITICVLLAPKVTLFYQSVGFNENVVFGKLILEKGPVYYYFGFTAILYFVLELYIFVSEFFKTKYKEDRNQIVLMFASISCTLLGFALYLLGLTKGLDTTIIGMFVSLILLFVMLVKYKVFDAATIAKNEALDNSNTGILILNHRDEIVYINPLAKGIIESFKIKNKKEYFNKLANDNERLTYENKVFNVSSMGIVRDSVYYGQTIEFNDVTDEANYLTRLENNVKERVKEIQKIQRSLVNSFANLVEERDESTGAHIKSTSTYVELIARSLMKTEKYQNFITEEYVDLISSAAPLHDVGKVAIPDNVLLKPGKLIPQEFEVIKSHTTKGGEIIEKNLRGIETDEYVDIAKDIALYHHERYDGTGYPSGLAQEEIPLAARIMAVADVYDALRSERCYKPPYSKEEAINIIKQETETHFDPLVVEAFLENIDNLE